MSEYKYFSLDEFKCRETGENEIKHEFVEKLDELRELCGFPFIITSGYRSPNHSIEKAKSNPGTHAQGIACDISVTSGVDRMKLVKNAISLNFSGIGVAKDFVHVDIRESASVMWAY